MCENLQEQQSLFSRQQEDLLVLDKNSMRNPAAADARAEADRLGVDFLIPDTLLLEIIRTGRWPDEWVNDFRDWTDIPDRQWSSYGVGELLREERDSGARAVTVVDRELSASHRSLLEDLGRNDTQRLEANRPVFDQEADNLAQVGGPLHAEENFQQMRRLTEAWWGLVENRERELLAEDLDAGDDAPLVNIGRAALSPPVDGIILDAMVEPDPGYEREIAAQLVATPTFTRFSHGAFLAYGLFLRTQANRLGEQTNVERLLNQLLDLNYAAYALCCSGLQTSDRLLARIEAGLRIAAAERWG